MDGYYISGAIITVFVVGSIFILCDIIWNNEIEKRHVVKKQPESLLSLVSDDYEIDDTLID